MNLNQHSKNLIGFTVDSFQGLTPSIIIAGLRAFGIEFIEVTRSVFTETDQVAKKLGPMKMGFHLPLIHEDGWDFSSLDYKDEIDEIIHLVNTNKEKLHLIYAVSHPPEPMAATGHTLKTSETFLFENLKKLMLPIYLENVPGYSPKTFSQFYARARSALGDNCAGICFDGPHFCIQGHDPLEEFRSLYNEIGCVHLSDCLHDDDAHLPFNDGGVFPVQAFLQQMRDLGFSGSLTLEIKPRSLKDLEIYIQSYLTTLKYLHFGKYLTRAVRWFFLKPFIHHFLS